MALKNIIGQKTTTTGAIGVGATINLDGAALSGHNTFSAGGAVSGTSYSVGIKDGDARQVGRVTYTSGTPDTLTVDSVLDSTNGGSAITLTGDAEVYVDALVEDLDPGATDIDGLSDGYSLNFTVMLGGNQTAFIDSTAYRNTAVGHSAFFNITTGDDNTALGYQAGADLTSGANNTFLGATAGSFGTGITTGSNNTLIGSHSVPTSATVNNEFTLGDANIATLRCNQTTITALSDARDKANITDLSLGLSYLEKVRPVEFDWQRRVPDANDGKHQAGFIAQELMAVEDEHDAAFLGSVLRSNPDKLEAGPAALIPVMVKAIQELSERVRELEGQING